MKPLLALHPDVKTEFNGKVYIGIGDTFESGVLVEFLEQRDEDNDEEDILPYFEHIEGFSLFRIMPEIGLEHVDSIGTCDLDIPQIDLDKDKDYILRVIGVDEV